VEVFLHGIQVEALEGFGVVEAFAQGIGQRGMLAKDFQVELVRPPVPVRWTTASGMIERAL
jgi:hypothetical protein